jgi:hypothetical protein
MDSDQFVANMEGLEVDVAAGGSQAANDARYLRSHWLLAAGVSAGATSVALSAAPAGIPAGDIPIVIDPWTTNAEARYCTLSGSTLSFGTALSYNHGAGAPVLLVQDSVYVGWFGVEMGFTNDPGAANATALTNMLAQMTNLSAGLNNPPKIVFGPEYWSFSGTITVPANPKGMIFDLSGGTLLWHTDIGAGVYAIDCNNTVVTLRDGSLQGPATVTIGTDPNCMDGIRWGGGSNANGSLMENMNISGFRSGVVADFDDHCTIRQTKITNCWYGVYKHRASGTAGGDILWDRLGIQSCGRACVGIGSSQALISTLWTGSCTVGDSPCVVYVEDGAQISQDIEFDRVSFEFVGNAFWYGAAGSSGSRSIQNLRFHDCYLSQSNTYKDATLNATAIFWNASSLGSNIGRVTGDMLLPQFAAWTYLFGGATAGFGFGEGGDAYLNANSGWVTHLSDSTGNSPTSSIQGALGFVNDLRLKAESGSTAGIWQAAGGALASTSNAVQVTKGDLLELTTPGGGVYALAQKYQTAGAAPYGVSFETAETAPTYPLVLAMTKGIVTLNVSATDATITSFGQYLKPGATAGTVTKATGFSDGPIVGISLGGYSDTRTGFGSTRTVNARLLI